MPKLSLLDGKHDQCAREGKHEAVNSTSCFGAAYSSPYAFLSRHLT